MEQFGVRDGILLTNELGEWTEALLTSSDRAIETLPGAAIGFSRDEVVAISMVAASQHSQCPALKSCIYAITRKSEIEHVERATDEFAKRLTDAGQLLAPETITFPLLHMAEGSSLQH